MTITLDPDFVSQVGLHPPEIRADVFEAVLAVPEAFSRPGRHTGLGLRKLHASGIWEVRVGLGLRAILQLTRDSAIFRFLGTHDAVRKYLRNL